ncbi:RHS repeat-associated core domain-containing protein [Nocardiopsis xinjiangensis]|uniref:RHS repeat-associated core domain-containing protein n=1 Tax=Nocardiopsis xinjiangensis TaxID=124285 RepID=UPI001F4CA058|nr:RHS repeat-associated core domain-containing protein [Nocardiopsis xinjiangensis]
MSVANGCPAGAEPEAAPQDEEALADTCANWGNGGIQDWYPLERHQISDRLELAINTATGNLVVQHRDLTTAGTGLDLSVSSFYNSTDGQAGWTLSHGRDVGLQIFSNSIIFQGPSGYCERFDVDEDGGFGSPAGLNGDLEELDNGHYALTFHRGEYADQVWTFTAQGWWYSQADRNGNTHRMRYDSEGDLASVVDTQDRVTTFDWEEWYQPGSITGPTGQRATDYSWNDDGDLTTLTDRAGQDLEFSYTDGGLLESVTDPTGATWSISYNDDDQVSSLSVPDGSDGGAGTSYSYDDSPEEGSETAVEDPNGGESTFTYDDQGRQTDATDQVGNTRSQEWTSNSDVATTTDPLEASVTYDYDEFNNLIGTELPTGAATSVGFTDTANPAKPTSVTTPDGDELSMSYDDAGNMVSATQEDMDLTVTDIDYTGQGLVSAVTDANGNTTEYSYDRAGNMVAMSEPGPVGDMEFGYDALSRVTSVTDGNGTTLEYGYDRLDRIVSISHEGEVIESIDYDGNGRQIATHTDQATTEFTYNGRGDLLTSERSDSSGTETAEYSYDAAGNLTELTEHGQTTTYAYDAAFRLTSLTDHTGAETTFDNDANNQRTLITHPDGAEEARSYDDSARLTGITTTGAEGQELVTASYSYDNDGADSDQMRSRTVNGQSESFTYDGLGRLTSNGERDYAYDDAGNMIEAGDESFSYDDADQVTSARGQDVAHDEAGNMVERGGNSYEYSPTNQMLRSNDGDGDLSTSLSYDTTDQTQMRGITDVHDGERIERQLSNTALGTTNIASEGERTSYVRDPDGQLISMVDWAGDERFHYTLDGQNTVLALTAEGSEAESPDAVYEYSPYGEQSSETIEDSQAGDLNAFGYTGAYQFLDGTVHLSHRFLDTFTLNFTQPDPSRQEMNNSTYAMCDPINKMDPTGLSTCFGNVLLLGASGLGLIGAAMVTGGSMGAAGFFLGVASMGFLGSMQMARDACGWNF